MILDEIALRHADNLYWELLCSQGAPETQRKAKVQVHIINALKELYRGP